MHKYHKIQTVFKRDPNNKYKTLLEGEWSLPEFEFLQDNLWDFTEKVDGTNIRINIESGFNGYDQSGKPVAFEYDWLGKAVTIKGRTDRAELPKPLVESLTKKFDGLQDILDSLEGDICLYGEGYGPKIQNGGKYRSDQGFVLFDAFYKGAWLNEESLFGIATLLKLDIVPVLTTGTLHEMVYMAKKGFESTWGYFQAEGIVARPSIELLSNRGDRIITKVKCSDFNR